MRKQMFRVKIYESEQDQQPSLCYIISDYTSDRARAEAMKQAARDRGGYWEDYHAVVEEGKNGAR
jgi:hypothetical protein